MKRIFRLVFFTAAGWLVSAAVLPRVRASLIKLFGGRVGSGVRVHRCTLMNHYAGFGNLDIGNGVFIGDGVVLDLAGPLRLGDRVTVSVRSVLLTHTDSGASHGNVHAVDFPPTARGLTIGSDVWIGAGAIVLEKADLAPAVIVGAGAVVTRALDEPGTYAGVPARRIR